MRRRSRRARRLRQPAPGRRPHGRRHAEARRHFGHRRPDLRSPRRSCRHGDELRRRRPARGGRGGGRLRVRPQGGPAAPLVPAGAASKTVTWSSARGERHGEIVAVEANHTVTHIALKPDYAASGWTPLANEYCCVPNVQTATARASQPLALPEFVPPITTKEVRQRRKVVPRLVRSPGEVLVGARGFEPPTTCTPNRQGAIEIGCAYKTSRNGAVPCLSIDGIDGTVGDPIGDLERRLRKALGARGPLRARRRR